MRVKWEQVFIYNMHESLQIEVTYKTELLLAKYSKLFLERELLVTKSDFLCDSVEVNSEPQSNLLKESLNLCLTNLYK